MGIGREITLELARERANIAFQFPPDDAQETVRLLKEMKAVSSHKNLPYFPIKADFSDSNTTRTIFKAALAALSNIDVLINNAGVSWTKSITYVTPAQFDRLFNIHFKTPYFLTQQSIASMKTQGSGAIINIASIHALRGSPRASVYASTKGALIALTQQLAIKLGPDNIRVHAIAPGYINVARHKIVNPKHNPLSDDQKIPSGRVGNPEDVAKLTAFLVSDDSSFINGETVVIDGASTKWMGVHEAARQRTVEPPNQPYM